MVAMNDDKKYPSLKIQNIVLAGRIARSLDIEFIADNLDGCVFSRKKFPGAVYHMKDPKTVALLFESGKIVITGITCMENIQKGLDALTCQLNRMGLRTLPVPDVSLTNMVCSYDTGSQINLNKVMIMFNYENVEYEPEQFPGLVYRLPDPKIVALLFSSGKIIITGGKNLGDVRRGLQVLVQRLDTVG